MKNIDCDYHIFDSIGEYRGSLRNSEDAACLVAFLGEGSTVRVNDDIVWTEGSEDFSAGDSYDLAAERMITKARLL